MDKQIIIDATHYGAESATGVENYVQQLLPRLSAKLHEAGWKVRWVGHSSHAPKGKPEKVEWITSPHATLWGQVALLRLLQKEHPDLFFTPSGIPPVRYVGKTAITVHDMAAYISPAVFSWGQRFRLRTLMGRAAKKAAVIFTPSEYSKQEIIRFWNTDPDKIQVTPLSYDEESAEPEEVNGIDSAAPVLLFIGRIETKKNLSRIVDAFCELDHPTAQLVLAGKDGLGAETIHDAICALPDGLRQRVYCPGYVTNGQRKWLLECTNTMLIPGALEGFGLPLLEAFKHSVPAVCANSGPLPEIGGDACLYASPDSSSDWARAINEILTDPELRQRLQEKGSERVGHYSWEHTAELTTEAISNL